MTEFTAILVLALLGFSAVKLYKLFPQAEPEEEEEPTVDFDSLSVAEMVDTVKTTSDELQTVENLITDLSICDPRSNVKVVTMSYLGDDGENHTLDVWCDGINADTEAVRGIAERRVRELKSTLDYECAVLSNRTRSGQNNGKKVAFLAGEVSDRD